MPLIESGAPLLDYLEMESPEFNYTYDGILDNNDKFIIHKLNLTSGSWLPEQVSDPIWTHPLIIIIPKYNNEKMEGKALFYSTDQIIESREEAITTPAAQTTIKVAMLSGSVAALLYGNPGPMKFTDKKEELYGPSLLAHSWNRAINKTEIEPSDNIIFPVIRAVIKGLDTVQEFVLGRNETGEIDTFCIISETPFVAWMAGLDSRIGCSIPLMADMVNATATLEHSYRTMAAWSYYYKGYGHIFDQLGSRKVFDLLRHVDPAMQRNRFKQDVYMLRAGNDQSSVPDATRHFYDKMSLNQKVCHLETWSAP